MVEQPEHRIDASDDPVGTAAQVISIDDEAADARQSACRTVMVEAEGLARLGEALTGDLGTALSAAVALIASRSGKLVVSGIGKSGLVGRKLAATLASTGTPAFFLHPADASHGDLGMIAFEDGALVLSWSGETSELKDLVDYCTRFDVPIIAVTAAATSSLARLAKVALVLPDVTEACPNGLAPTSSTTLQMVIGDALAIALLERRKFSAGDFHRFHPKGRLGAQLLTIGALMTVGPGVPRVATSATILEAVSEMTEKRFGVTAVVDKDDFLVGAFSDGDLRRSLATGSGEAPVGDHMSRRPLAVERSLLASEALSLMNRKQISQLFISENDRLIGIVHLHDLLRVGVM